MKKVSLRNLSLLGLVLMGASAVTAAILPKSTTKLAANGVLQNNSTGGSNEAALRTCVDAGLNPATCDWTATDNQNTGSFTTTANGGHGTSADAVDTTGTFNTGLDISGGFAHSVA